MPVSLGANPVILILTPEPAIAGIACDDRGSGWCALVARYFPAMGGETVSAAIALRTCNPRPESPNKSRS
jgi:hypothetical protein